MKDGELIEQLGTCSASFERFYDRYADALYRYALAVSGATPVAEEALQETFLYVLQHPDGYDPARSPTARNWLYGILKNRLRPLMKPGLREVEAPAEMVDVAASPELHARLGQSARALLAGIQALPLPQREVLVMCALQGLDYADVAQILDVPVGTVRSRLNRARATLKAHPDVERLELGEAMYEYS